ncbi:hypothetical protein F4818DRAFT_434108 [Hypoxylon cercidicola]|nr:hypothetical protein F4818DRAFT_434108 [Hypoxylon cercidicola]
MATQSNYYAVYKLRFNLAMQDPDVPGTRYHTVLFVETNPDKSGRMYHVTGDITSGMTFDTKSYHNPELSQNLHTKEFILATVPAPEKQKAFNIRTMKTEPFKTWDPLTFYEPGEQRRPLFKCTEWTEQRAIPALKQAGLIISAPGGSGTGAQAGQAGHGAQAHAQEGDGQNGWVWDTTHRRYRRWDGVTRRWIWQK